MDNSHIQALKAAAFDLGFNLFGIVPAAPAKRLDAYLGWITQAMHGRMGYLARPDRLARRQDLNVILPGVQTIICVGLHYHTERLPQALATDPSRGRFSNYAWGADYHDMMTPRLEQLASELRRLTGNQSDHRVYVDTGAILERDHAEQAGLGFTGKNTMLIQPRQGSFFFLGEILTTAVLTAASGQEAHVPPPPPMPSCGSCSRCLTACPTTAFPSPYVLDARRCISYLTIELKDWIPHELRPLMGNWVYGCDICQDVCPFNRFAAITEETAFRSPDWDRAAPRLLDLLTMTEDGFRTRFVHSPVKRIKRARLLRNACVAAGNWGSETAVSSLVRLLTDPAPVVRGHAAWALHQIGSSTGHRAMRTALSQEMDGRVRQELAGQMAQESGGEETRGLIK